MPIKITLEDGTTRELSDGFPLTQDELNKVIQDRLAPKLNRITELESQAKTLAGEKDAAVAAVAEKDQQIATLSTEVGKKGRALLVAEVAHAKGVPAKWLRGDDKAALEASADEWLADARGVTPTGSGGGENNGGGTGGGDGAGGGAGGYVGSAGTGDETPARPSFEEAKQRAYERAKNQRKGALV